MVNKLYPTKPRKTRQTEPTPGRKDEVKNFAGGYVYSIEDTVEHLRRFIVLGGKTGALYYADAEVTMEALRGVVDYVNDQPTVALAILQDFARKHPPKKEGMMFVLALLLTHDTLMIRQSAAEFAGDLLKNAPLADTMMLAWLIQAGTGHQFGRLIKKLFAQFWQNAPINALVYQSTKYRKRHGWAPADLIQVAHPKTKGRVDEEARNVLIRYLNNGYVFKEGDLDQADAQGLIQLIAFDEIQTMPDTADPEALTGIIEAGRLTWEHIPTYLLNVREVWEAMLPNLPGHALLRQLPRLDKLGLFDGKTLDVVLEKLAVKPLHPFRVLLAALNYPRKVDDPNQRVIDVLDAAFTSASALDVGNIGNALVALDSSGSMCGGTTAGSTITPVEAGIGISAALCNALPNADSIVFTDSLSSVRPFPARGVRYNDLLTMWNSLRTGRSTDLTVPIAHALKTERDYDLIVIITDLQTWYGQEKVIDTWRRYKRKYPKAKFVAVSLLHSIHSLFPEGEPDTLNISGFDATAMDTMLQWASNAS